MSAEPRWNRTGAGTLRRLLRGAVACVGILCARADGAAAQAQTTFPPGERSQLEAVMNGYKESLCKDPGSELCAHFKKFMAGSVPKLPRGKFFTLGKIVLGTRVQPGRFDTFLSENTDRLRLASTVTTPENPSEEQDCLRYIESLRAGKPDTASAIHAFWNSQFDRQEKYVPKIQDGYLVYTPQGATPILLRQNGKVLYAFAIALRPRLPGSFDTVPVPAFSYFYLP